LAGLPLPREPANAGLPYAQQLGHLRRSYAILEQPLHTSRADASCRRCLLGLRCASFNLGALVIAMHRLELWVIADPGSQVCLGHSDGTGEPC
jgi:hypothetical protein